MRKRLGKKLNFALAFRKIIASLFRLVHRQQSRTFFYHSIYNSSTTFRAFYIFTTILFDACSGESASCQSTSVYIEWKSVREFDKAQVRRFLSPPVDWGLSKVLFNFKLLPSVPLTLFFVALRLEIPQNSLKRENLRFSFLSRSPLHFWLSVPRILSSEWSSWMQERANQERVWSHCIYKYTRECSKVLQEKKYIRIDIHEDFETSIS